MPKLSNHKKWNVLYYKLPLTRLSTNKFPYSVYFSSLSQLFVVLFCLSLTYLNSIFKIHQQSSNDQHHNCYGEACIRKCCSQDQASRAVN